MAKNILDILTKFPDGDDLRYWWSTRLNAGADQFLKDFQSENQLPNKSATLRIAVSFLMTYWPTIAEKEDIAISPKLIALSNAMKAKQMYEQRANVMQEILELMSAAAETNVTPLRIQYTTAAEDLAKAFNIPYPPENTSILTIDPTANRVLELVRKWLARENTDRITVNFLNQHTSLNAAELKDALEKLSAEDHVTLTVDSSQRGGDRIWISMDAMKMVLGGYDTHY